MKKISLYQNKSSTLDFGQVIENDACEDIFFKSKENCHIYHAIDVAVKRLLAIHSKKEETTLGYQKLLTNFLQNMVYHKFFFQIKEERCEAPKTQKLHLRKLLILVKLN